MIPASYLFKQVYSQAWEEPTAAAPIQKPRPIKGLLTPLASAIGALLSHRPNARSHQVGSHAYD
ncbi:hypothetical protein [Devosia psychrophila]|uniref:Uncharacterized protein n=1 Tax=Devosia psychrophila TaxID=728005 RepID=A0A0F5Q196_9HYPH|nr:hypothetical protein [Devosia psychrophila]KKC34687.1 hypothetical protein WH91_01405 [Devosia psychrophila]SFC88178.1 hypothetical protein SAMN04488059_11389 [Devosia psychrophila]